MHKVGNTAYIEIHETAFKHFQSDRYNEAGHIAELQRLFQREHITSAVFCYGGLCILRADERNGIIMIDRTNALPKRERKERKRGLNFVAGGLFSLFVSCFCTGTTAFGEDTTEGEVDEEPSWFEEAIIDSVWYLFDVFIKAAMEFLDWVTAEAKGKIPSGLSSALSGTLDYLAIANEWVPLTFGFGLLIAYYAIWILAIIVKWCVRFIP